MMSSIAFVFALILAELMIPVFENLSGKDLSLFSSSHIIMPAIFSVLSIITGIVAGIYPAFYLSSSGP